ncbi:MAG: hypothetical protein ACRDSP_26910 [Pseudonocardiaceae bacterium]
MASTDSGGGLAVWERSSDGAGAAAPRVFICYAHEPGSDAHAGVVGQLWLFLWGRGIDAYLDLIAAGRRQGWVLWRADQIREADHVLVQGFGVVGWRLICVQARPASARSRRCA